MAPKEQPYIVSNLSWSKIFHSPALCMGKRKGLKNGKLPIFGGNNFPHCWIRGKMEGVKLMEEEKKSAKLHFITGECRG